MTEAGTSQPTPSALQARRMLTAAVALAQRGEGAIPDPDVIGATIAARLGEGEGLVVFDLDALPGWDD
jgi:hypothetical protein